jgi:hypothetical protein
MYIELIIYNYYLENTYSNLFFKTECLVNNDERKYINNIFQKEN